MIPKRIVLENFLSFGSPETEIVFGDDEPLWVLSGANGVGKSAVFDAMTYSLYGEHRGGASDHTSLVRHGANGFRVTFEFEFNAVVYQITRNRPLSGRPTQSIKQWADGGWTKSVQLPPSTGRRDQIKLWTERTLGLEFPAFKASVLLRQGEADAIITAGGTERLNILKKIIGLEAYETLSDKVHARARQCSGYLDDLRTRRAAMTPVSEEEVQAAQEVLAIRMEERSRAYDALAKAAERVPLARQWAELDTEAKTLQREILAADERAKTAARIREDCARLKKLDAAVPVLRQLVKVRDELGKADEALTERRAETAQLANSIRAKQLHDEIGRHEKLVTAAASAEKLREELAGFDPELPDQLEAAQISLQEATDALTATLQEKAASSGLLQQAKEKQETFSGVGVDVKCSMCGQQVTAEHARQERDRLREDVQRLEKAVRDWKKKEGTATKRKQAASDDCSRLAKLAAQQETTARVLAEKQKTLLDLGITTTPDELRQQLDEKKGQVKLLEVEVGDQSRANLAALNQRLEEVQKKVLADNKTIASLNGQQSTLLGQLTPEWGVEVQQLDARKVNALGAEQQALVAAGVLDSLRQLEQDAVQRAAWAARQEQLTRQIAEFRQEGRVPVKEAEAQLQAARSAGANADVARDDAKMKLDGLAAEAERFRHLVAEIGAAEKKAELHAKLDTLLGKGGLQRELVRTAEQEIVRLANDTVQNLSDGDLTVELEDGADSDDEAFALQVRRADSATPIGVNYLSGSQKFRVAVSVALAIGRFAAGQARPLESVIIDEGFGSLDRDGLRAAAAELNRLRQHLRRIILVSHQEEFADRFPVVIRLAQGENGTTAQAVRR